MSDHDNIDDELILWLQNSSNSSSIPIDTSHDHDLPSVEVHSLFPIVNEGKISCSKDVVEMSQECENRKRRRSDEIHNLNEKLRRQKIKEKVYTLQKLIPNCNKGDVASILEDAVKIISTLQYQVRMMSMERGFCMFHSPLMMMPQPGQQGMQISCLGPSLQTGPLGAGAGIGMGMPAMFPSFNFPTSQLGLPYQHLSTSLATSTLPAPGGIPAATHSFQYPGNVLESLPSATSTMDLEAMYATDSRFQSTIGGESGPSQGALSISKESRPSIDVISEVRSTSTLPAPGGMPASAHPIQNPRNVLESLPPSTSSIDLEALYATFSGFQSTTGGESGPSQGAPSISKESSPGINVISETFTNRGSTSRGPPSTIIPPPFHTSSGSTTRPKDSFI